ncbi:unnamed protein product [Aureobasidium vineae]|uniref:Arginase/deacetylase n=1 Tax=Aureobasidium vineae TaxID=2773715 RepID=A0A9N8JI85_9PEZI|nr:unnamed protein product [Aureobasidium vineae]
MRSFFTLHVLAAVVAAAPRPQDIDFDLVEQAADPVLITPALDVATQVATVAAVTEQAAAASGAVSAEPAINSASPVTERDLVARDSTCAKQKAGRGPVASPDTPEAFLVLDHLSKILSTTVATPYGYSQVFANQKASLSASVYMGLHTLDSYDVPGCQSICDQNPGCVAFNMYAERDPTLEPNSTKCPNPASTTNYKVLHYLGAPVSVEQANNFGQWRASFNVVIAASNAYNKDAPPPSVAGFTDPVGLGGAINAPLDSNHKDTFMGSKFFPFSQDQGFTLESCTSACTAQTAYNKAHPNKDGSFKTCAFVNGYVLSRAGVPQGLYCSIYTVSNSYAYSVVTRPEIPAGVYCPQGRSEAHKSCGRYSLLFASVTAISSIFATSGDVTTCALDCLANPDCLAWSTNDNKLSWQYNENIPVKQGHCQSYTQRVADIINEYDHKEWNFYDDDSYATLFDYDCFDAQGNGCGEGLRSRLTGTGFQDFENDVQQGFMQIEVDDIDRWGVEGIAERIIARVGTEIPVYLSIDIDVLDVAFAPATGTPEAGGWSTRELIRILRGIEGLNVVGADIVEVAPAYDGAGEPTSVAAAQIVYEVVTSMVKRGLAVSNDSKADKHLLRDEL